MWPDGCDVLVSVLTGEASPGLDPLPTTPSQSVAEQTQGLRKGRASQGLIYGNPTRGGALGLTGGPVSTLCPRGKSSVFWGQGAGAHTDKQEDTELVAGVPTLWCCGHLWCLMKPMSLDSKQCWERIHSQKYKRKFLSSKYRCQTVRSFLMCVHMLLLFTVAVSENCDIKCHSSRL